MLDQQRNFQTLPQDSSAPQGQQPPPTLIAGITSAPSLAPQLTAFSKPSALEAPGTATSNSSIDRVGPTEKGPSKLDTQLGLSSITVCVCMRT